jgi:hypothetical protein
MQLAKNGAQYHMSINGMSCVGWLIRNRMKNDKTPTEMANLHRNIARLIPVGGFNNSTWNQYKSQHTSSIKHRLTPTLKKQIEAKWKSQEPDERLKYKRVKNPAAKPDGTERLQTKNQAVDYLRRQQGRCSIFNIPLEEIKRLFKTWCQDRYTYSSSNHRKQCP